ncbi:MAG: DUF365 domain-containing protein [Conexivisphaerales archaeon]
MKESVIGVVFPLLPEHTKRILEQKKDVLVKYVSRIPQKPQNFRLSKGMKVLFYVSGSGRRIAGEGEINEVVFMPPLEAYEKYRARIVLSRQELLDYARLQPKRTLDKELLVLEMKHLRKFDQAVTFPRNVSMAGQYITRESYETILPHS